MEQDRLEVVVAAQAQQATTAIKQLTANINACANAVSTLVTTLNNMNTQSITNTANKVKNVQSDLTGMVKTVNNIGKAFSSAINLGKFYAIWNVTKKFRQTLKECVNLSLDFIETTNKFEVSMGNMVDKAYDFQDALSSAFGLARTEMMEFQATFNNIMSAIPRIIRRNFVSNFRNINKIRIRLCFII